MGRFIQTNVFLLIFFSLGTLQAQLKDSLDFPLYFEINQDHRFFTTDQLQQIYVVTPTNEVIKYSKQGRELFRYNNNYLGELAHVDVTNPFNLLLYYPDFLKVIVLDRTMSEVAVFDLTNLQVSDIRAVGLSNDNNVWLFNDLTTRLEKVNQQGQVLLSSPNLFLLLETVPVPNFIIERDNKVFVNVPQSGIMVFDNFARFLTTIEVKELESFQVKEEELFYLKENQLFALHQATLQQAKWTLPQSLVPLNQLNIGENRFFTSDGNSVKVFAELKN